METKNGGSRPGSGRKSSFPGEKTELLRIPESQVPLIRSYLDAYRQRKAERVNAEERFVYALEVSRLKMGLIEAINYLKTYFSHIPIVNQKINYLQQFFDYDKSDPKRVASDSWETDGHLPSGVPVKLSLSQKDKKLVFSSEVIVSSKKESHQHKLSLQETDELIKFLISMRQSLD